LRTESCGHYRRHQTDFKHCRHNVEQDGAASFRRTAGVRLEEGGALSRARGIATAKWTHHLRKKEMPRVPRSMTRGKAPVWRLR
jgi:hypothetical protein